MSKIETKITTPEFRVSFPSVFTPSDFNGTETFQVTMLFDKGTDLSVLKDAVARAAKEKWGAKLPAGFRSPIRDGAEKSHIAGYDGCIFVTAKSSQKPGVVDRALNILTDSSEFYAGCIARATVVAFAYDRNGNKGVSFILSNVQKIADGEAFSSRRSAQDDFDAIEDIF